jgi:outer membrane protein assembly factor BamB
MMLSRSRQAAPWALACLLILMALWAAAAADHWTEFRGSNGTGLSDAIGLPIRWGEQENVRWKTLIHDKGWSSPVIGDNQVWLTTATEDGKQRFVLGVDRATGKVLHDRKVFDVDQPQSMGDAQTFNSYASPTPALEAGRVYAHFGSAGTACLDTATGKVLWTRRDLPCNHHRGAASSPVLFRNLLILTFDGFDQQYLVALDTATGETRWKQPRVIDYGTDNGDRKKAFSTPAVFMIDGQPQLVSPSAAATVAYDPVSGKELWKVYHGGMNVAARPLLGQGQIYLCTGDGPTQLFAVRTGGAGDVTKSHVTWSAFRGVPNRSTPLLLNDLLYLGGDKSGVATCLDAKTGTPVWQQRLAGDYIASPVAAEGRVYFFSRDGITFVLAAGREAKILARNQLDDGCMATPAIAGKELYVRTKTHLYRIEQGR